MSALPCRIDLARRRLWRTVHLCWLLGLLCGCTAAWRLNVCLIPDLAAGSFRACIGRLLAELVCAAAVFSGASAELLSAAVFCRAAVFGYAAQGIRAGFGSAGWLLWPLVLWPQLLFFPVLFFLPAGRRRAGAYLASAAAALAIGFADFRLVMPFLAFLIE